MILSTPELGDYPSITKLAHWDQIAEKITSRKDKNKFLKMHNEKVGFEGL